jgi:LL-diaminopimelate aminotransferase
VGTLTEIRPARRLEHVPPYLFARFDEVIASKRRAGEWVVSLGMGDPDQPTFARVVGAATDALRDPRNHRYPSNRGRLEFRRSVADFYARRFGAELDPEHEVIPALGAKECLAQLCVAFLDPGSVALVPDPGYPVYRVAALLAGARVVGLPLDGSRDFAPDFDALPADALPDARLLFLNYPNNPTGAVATTTVLRDAVRFAREHRLLLVHDNPYSQVVYDGYRAPSILAIEGAREVAVEVFSLSKGYNMAGWRCGAVVGNRDVLAHYWRLKSNLDVGVFDVVQLAAARALQADIDVDVETRNRIYERRRDAVVAGLSAMGCPVVSPRATIYVWAPLPVGFDSAAAFSEHVLQTAGVVLTPGSLYGSRGEGHFRISLGCADDELHEGLARLRGLGLRWEPAA